MADKQYCLSVHYGQQQMRADQTGAHPVIVEFTRLLIRRLRVLDVPMYPHCVWRTKADQESAFVRGVTTVRYPDSAHNWGCATDIVHGLKHWGLTPKQWSIVGHIGFEIAHQRGFKLVWGGDDPGVNDAFDWDPAHWELADWRAHMIAR
ncbi:hypothetical protein [Mesorhizobium shangrilense]|uniref:M15 family peptidase n=1 Tax=Mesorhizobium shangrilense TaxID=460060 RepID=A0ABV2DNJ9_9HYPH